MPAGLIVYNDANTILIDDTNPNLALKDNKQTFTAVNAGGAGTAFVGQGIFNSIQTPICAYKVSAAQLVQGYVAYQTGGTVAFQLIGPPGQPTWGDGTVYCFDKPGSPVGLDDAALQVFNSAGILCFDSRLKHPVIAAMQVVAAATTYNFTIPSGRAYAVIADHMNMIMTSTNIAITTTTSDIGKMIIIVDVTGM